ncbi:hypothetical protein VP1G_02078 [Cytospora mali]|uniref:Uncharacterized protein n=1 Tax=Cytospora mali TaxID=578113 RepID=A0A194USH8_CYTMA|nr:hypothetical protein VP1G_02078 [Valsa mali var. pyri (nom. inval.)]
MFLFPTVGGVLIGDKTRPILAQWKKFPSERLNDVLGLISTRGTHQDELIDEAISSAVEKQNIDYTVECLLQTRNSQANMAPFSIEDRTSSCLERRQVIPIIAQPSICAGATCPPMLLRSNFERLMRLRRYDRVEMLLLVEEICYNVNTQGYGKILTVAGKKAGIYKHETPIHCLVKGASHWWKVSEALPYLVRHHGANLDIQDGWGRTPLNAALDTVSLVTFSRRAVDALIELRADIRRADLTRASNDIVLTDLLIRKGAVPTAKVLLAAIKSRNCKVLSIFLSNGGDPNIRPVKEEGSEKTVLPLWETPLDDPKSPSRKMFSCTGPYDPREIPEDEMYPLDYATNLYAQDTKTRMPLSNIKRIRR